MGIFNKLFGSEEPKVVKTLPWIALTSVDQLNEIREKSKTKTQIIFKHSTRCGISRMVMNQFVDRFELTDNEIDIYYLDLLNYREVSNEVGYKFQVLHESPQLLVIKNETCIANASHGNINEVDLQQFI